MINKLKLETSFAIAICALCMQDALVQTLPVKLWINTINSKRVLFLPIDMQHIQLPC